MPTIALQRFNMEWIKDDKVVVLIGKRETGKSFLVRDLLYYHQDIPVGTIISGTEGANSFYSKIFPPIFIHDKFKPEVIARYMARQRKVNKMLQSEMAEKGYSGMDSHKYFENGFSDIDPRALCILDDCLYDKSWVNNTDIRSLFMNGRHYFSMFIITMQYALGVPPALRTNIDFVFILRENIFANRKRLYDQYAGMFKTFDEFCQVMDQCTENFECLVINNNSKSNKIEEQVYWYKADDHEDFQLGAPQFWKYHSENYGIDDEDDDPYDQTRAKKNSIPLTVKKMNMY